MSKDNASSRRAIMLGYAQIILLAVLMVYAIVAQRSPFSFIQMQLVPTGFVNDDGLYVEPVRVGDKIEYWFSPAPPESDWIVLEQIPLQNQAWYPVYYTPNGYQVLRQNKLTGLFVAHGWVDGVSMLFIVDTGATQSLISERRVLDRLKPVCLKRVKVVSVDKVYQTCISRAGNINLDGFIDRAYTDDQFHDQYVYSFGGVEHASSEPLLTNLLGMNVVSQFDFIIKYHYMYIFPRSEGGFYSSDGVRALRAPSDLEQGAS